MTRRQLWLSLFFFLIPYCKCYERQRIPLGCVTNLAREPCLLLQGFPILEILNDIKEYDAKYPTDFVFYPFTLYKQ